MEEKHYQRGYYTGAFDLLHVGHVIALKAAAKQCDQLIVGVSTDEVIKDYKHKEPVIPFEERLEIVASVKGVTLAIPQTDLYNKVEVCKALGCDVIFSCEEYQRETYEGREMTPKEEAGVERWEQIEQEASENGIDVVYLPRTQGTSSSQIKETIVQQKGYQEPQGIMLYSEGESCDEISVVM